MHVLKRMSDIPFLHIVLSLLIVLHLPYIQPVFSDGKGCYDLFRCNKLVDQIRHVVRSIGRNVRTGLRFQQVDASINEMAQ